MIPPTGPSRLYNFQNDFQKNASLSMSNISILYIFSAYGSSIGGGLLSAVSMGGDEGFFSSFLLLDPKQ